MRPMQPLTLAELTSTKQATEQTTTYKANRELPPSEEAPTNSETTVDEPVVDSTPAAKTKRSRKKKGVGATPTPTTDDDILVADTIIENVNVYVQEPADVKKIKKALTEEG